MNENIYTKIITLIIGSFAIILAVISFMLIKFLPYSLILAVELGLLGYIILDSCDYWKKGWFLQIIGVVIVGFTMIGLNFAVWPYSLISMIIVGTSGYLLFKKGSELEKLEEESSNYTNLCWYFF